MRTKIRLCAIPSLYVLLAISIMIIPIRWVVAWLISVGVHEISHYLALKSCGISVYRVVFGPFGARMETLPVSGWREVFCAFAGPLGSISLLTLSAFMPRTALCGAVHGLINLLPIFPLDGGRIIHGCMGKYRIGRVISMLLEWLVLIALLIFAFYGWIRLSLGPGPLVFCLIFTIKTRKIKFPCKERKQAVQ